MGEDSFNGVGLRQGGTVNTYFVLLEGSLASCFSCISYHAVSCEALALFLRGGAVRGHIS